MKAPLLLSLVGFFAAGHILPTTIHSPARTLRARNDPDPNNPDNDPAWKDPLTGDEIPKSRILTGLGPEAAEKRWFDWDESCADAGQRQKIVAAFDHVQELVKSTSKHLDNLYKDKTMPKPIIDDASKPNEENQKHIFNKDHAFAQMFLGLDTRIKYVKDSFDLVMNNAVASAGDRGGGKPGALRFICNPKNEVLEGDRKTPLCGDPKATNFAQGMTVIPYTGRKVDHVIEPKYKFEKATSIVFCPPFFQDDAFPLLDAIIGAGHFTLDKIECAERVLLHEYMHVPWIRNMVPTRDEIGWFKAADNARVSGWGEIKKNPDNYAWFALYAYFNHHDKGEKLPECGRDVWPEGTNKPNKGPK